MKRRHLIAALLSFLVLIISLNTSSAYIHNDFEKEYYWAKDYYHSPDFVRTSSQTYILNTHNQGYRFATFEDYQNHLFVRHHPYLISPPIEKKVIQMSRIDQTQKTYYQHQPQPHYYAQHYPREGIKRDYTYYSPIMDKTTTKSCYVIPPMNILVYIKC